jgi:putative transposase
MKRRQCSSEQIITILEQAERGEQTLGTVCRAHGITETTFSRWRQTFGGLTVPDAQRLRELEQENTRPKRWLAARALAVEALQEGLANQSCPSRRAARRSRASSRVVARRPVPAAYWACPAPRSSTRPGPSATRHWPTKSRRWPRGIGAMAIGAGGPCGGGAGSPCTRHGCIGSGSGRHGKGARATVSAEWGGR